MLSNKFMTSNNISFHKAMQCIAGYCRAITFNAEESSDSKSSVVQLSKVQFHELSEMSEVQLFWYAKRFISVQCGTFHCRILQFSDGKCS